MTDIADLPEFLDVWNGHFREHPCALTVVATKGLALLESKIEINIFGLREAGKTKKETIAHAKSDHMRLGPAAVRAGDLVCLSGLYAADENGAFAQSVRAAGLRHLGAPVQHQMRAILGAAEEICAAAGTALANVLRAHHFVSDLEVGLSRVAGLAARAAGRRASVRRRAAARNADSWMRRHPRRLVLSAGSGESRCLAGPGAARRRRETGGLRLRRIRPTLAQAQR